MAGFDRTELIKGLQGAFNQSGATKTEDRLTIETVSVERHVVNRVTNIKPQLPEDLAIQKFPEAYVVKDICNLFDQSKNEEAKKASAVLKQKLSEAAVAEDRMRVTLIADTAKELHTRIALTPVGTAMRDMTLVYAADKIMKL